MTKQIFIDIKKEEDVLIVSKEVKKLIEENIKSLPARAGKVIIADKEEVKKYQFYCTRRAPKTKSGLCS
jgi:hypothetical protein